MLVSVDRDILTLHLVFLLGSHDRGQFRKIRASLIRMLLSGWQESVRNDEAAW